MTSLESFFARPTSPERPVVRGDVRTSTLAALLRHAAAIARRLPDPTPGSEIAFAFARDRAACAAALLATWARGHVAALPTDAARENVTALLGREQNVGFLHDTGVGRGLFVPELFERTADDVTPLSLATPLDDRTVLSAFQRAPDGEVRVSSWTAEGLLDEVDGLARRMRLAAGTALLSPLSPTVPSALFAALLVPLRSGAEVEGDVLEVGPPLATRARAWGAQGLVASAHHARILARLAPGALDPSLRLFCVDEELDARHAALLEERHAIRATSLAGLPLERRTPAPLGLLAQALHAIPGVTDVAARTLQHAGEAPLLLVVVAAPDVLEHEVRRVAERHTPGGGRCRTRCVPSLPRDANGRLPAERHWLAFGLGRDGRETTSVLAWTPLDAAPDERRFRTRIPERYRFFEGHFAPYPVLAGVVQIHELVLPCARRSGFSVASVSSMQNLKFLARIAPGDEVRVLIRTVAPATIAFEILRGETLCSSGRVHFRR